ncbi:hypothetical protein LX36DRAFT_179987 [Colletotrichum falcatum]|nr:hypothetical protein LX36DRAFT_179987 [Colletotrichum falcatum]
MPQRTALRVASPRPLGGYKYHLCPDSHSSLPPPPFRSVRFSSPQGFNLPMKSKRAGTRHGLDDCYTTTIPARDPPLPPGSNELDLPPFKGNARAESWQSDKTCLDGFPFPERAACYQEETWGYYASIASPREIFSPLKHPHGNRNPREAASRCCWLVL